jgi:MSHA pilin protein MshA
MSKASQGGFTLIELVVVIVILGVLAAFAVPRFMGLEGQARIATVKGLAGSVRSAAALAHSSQLAQGLAPDTSITVGGATITMSNGYPTRTDLDNILEEYSGFTYTEATGVFTKDGATATATCSVTYTAPTAANTSPSVVVATGGC